MKLMVKVTPIFVIVALVFVCYTLYLLMKRPGSYVSNSLQHVFEPLDNPPSCLGPVTNEDVPSCSSGSGYDSNSSVPGCYNTVRGDSYNGFLPDFMSSDYILKTQMVTPVCPNNPVGEVGTEYGKEDRIETPEDDKSVTKKDAANADYNPKMMKPDETKKTPSFLDADMFGSTQQKEKATEPAADVKNTYLLNAPKTTVNTTVKADTSRGSCPPCPACQRCPEPVVECKRVVNYNAAGVSNLPVPMIADFSKF
jgi:hypothetical protein